MQKVHQTVMERSVGSYVTSSGDFSRSGKYICSAELCLRSTDILEQGMFEEFLESRASTTRRGLLAGNLKAIAVIAAGAVAARVSPAKADDGEHEYEDHGNGRGHAYGHDHGHGGRGQGGCYLKGTKIRTVKGERCVEELAVGDLLPTVFGGVRPIQRIVRFKRRKVDAEKPWSKDARPVRVMQSALAPNVPQADLFLTSGHAVLVDGVLVAAKSLINGTTIARYAAEEYEELEFFNIKLETHDAIFAEGAPCETLLKLDEPAIVSAVAGVPDLARDRHCAPIYGNGARSEIKWRLHSAMSRWIGPHKVDLIRERLQQRAAEVVLGAAG